MDGVLDVRRSEWDAMDFCAVGLFRLRLHYVFLNGNAGGKWKWLAVGDGGQWGGVGVLHFRFRGSICKPTLMSNVL